MTKKAWLLCLACSTITPLEAATLNVAAPEFALLNAQGAKRTLSSYKGRVVIINFWASWCAPCQIELPQLNQLATDESGKNVSVIAISVDQEQFKAGTLLTKLGLDSPEMEILWDPDSKAVTAYDAETMPTSFIVDAKGIVRFVHSGFNNHSQEQWRKEIDDLLKEIQVQ